MAAIVNETKMSREFQELLRKVKAKDGSVDAQFELAWRLENGEGVVKDERQAVEWYH